MAKKIAETPLMKQYLEMKRRHPDAILLFRVGDFYETFSDDAIDGVTKSVTDSAVSAAERAAYLLVKTIVQAALFLAFFLALMLLLRLLTHGLDRLFSLPVLAQLNGLGGAALSLIEGALLIFLIVFLAPRLGVTWFADHAAGTHLLAWFLNNTPRSIIASLT